MTAKINLTYDCVHHRIFKYGWSFEEAIATPLIARNAKSKRRQEGFEKDGAICKSGMKIKRILIILPSRLSKQELLEVGLKKKTYSIN